MSTEQPPGRLPSGLYDHTGYWLDRLRGLVSGSFAAALEGQDVSVAQWSVLVTIYRGDASTPGEVASYVNVDAGALTRLLDRLEAKDLLRRVASPGDRRSVRLVLTERARALVPGLAAIADANDRQFFGVLTDEEHRQLRELISRLLASRGVNVPRDWFDSGHSATER